MYYLLCSCIAQIKTLEMNLGPGTYLSVFGSEDASLRCFRVFLL
jgi:hypothetical protein